jgi:Ca-activated chloride channel homolog
MKIQHLLSILSIIALLAAPGCKKGPDPTASYKQVVHGSQPAPATQQQAQAVQEEKWPGAPESHRDVVANKLARNMLVLIDTSTSMEAVDRCTGGKLDRLAVAKVGLSEFVQVVKDEDNIGLVEFNSGNWVHVELAPAADTRDVFNQKVNELTHRGSTSMANAFAKGFAVLTKQAKRQLGLGEYYLVVVTDGAPNAGQDPSGWVEEIKAKTPIIIYTIGFCLGKGHVLNQDGTIYVEANSPAELSKALADIAVESEDYEEVK